MMTASSDLIKMATYAPMTGGLQHINPGREVNAGEVLIARFKNAKRKNCVDIWIAVVLPDGFEPGKGLSRRPKGAKPIVNGSEWTTPLHERVYPVYFPGRNT